MFNFKFKAQYLHFTDFFKCFPVHRDAESDHHFTQVIFGDFATSVSKTTNSWVSLRIAT